MFFKMVNVVKPKAQKINERMTVFITSPKKISEPQKTNRK